MFTSFAIFTRPYHAKKSMGLSIWKAFLALLSFLFKLLHRCFKPSFTPLLPLWVGRCSLSSVFFVAPLTSYFKPDLSAWNSWGQTRVNVVIFISAKTWPQIYLWLMWNTKPGPTPFSHCFVCVCVCIHMGVCVCCLYCTYCTIVRVSCACLRGVVFIMKVWKRVTCGM